jgi:RimJ/RimL family protein N-acetyltransferase
VQVGNKWQALDGDRVAGEMKSWQTPDGRRSVYYDSCSAEAYPLLAAHVPGPVNTVVDAAERQTLDVLADAGFHEVRIEDRYLIPVHPLKAPMPAGLTLISAADADVEVLMLLDCALRQDVPGSDGWQPDLEWFRAQTFGSAFDPTTYLIAVDEDRYVGLVRIWNGPRPIPRLGLIGVLPNYRRKGLARALIGAAFKPLLARAAPEATCEIDRENVASRTLMTGLGAVVTGTDIHLLRP